MKKGQTAMTKQGHECVLFPMQYMNISQGINGTFSHLGDMALDLSGKDTGIDPFYMPVTAKIVRKIANVGGIVYESVNKVQYADGTLDYIHFVTVHDNYIDDLVVGKTYKQGVETGDEGTKGFATGNHIHLVFGRGKSQGMAYPFIQNRYGTWVLPNQLDPRDVMFIDDTIIKEDLNYHFRKLNGWYKDDRHCWYFYENGELASGWKWIKKSGLNQEGWYYFNPDNNILQMNTYIDDPKGKCYVDYSGRWDGCYRK